MVTSLKYIRDSMLRVCSGTQHCLAKLNIFHGARNLKTSLIVFERKLASIDY